MTTTTPWLLALALASGCATTMTRDVYLDKTLAPKVAFDLHCDGQQVQYANLGPAEKGYMWDGTKMVEVTGISTQQGVTGCGHQARYVYTNREWILNAN